MMEQNLATMEVKQEAAETFLELLDRRIEKTVFTTKVLPKFLNSQGKCRGFWWGSCTEFWWQMRDLHPERFSITERKEEKNKSSAKEKLRDRRLNGKIRREEE